MTTLICTHSLGAMADTADSKSVIYRFKSDSEYQNAVVAQLGRAVVL